MLVGVAVGFGVGGVGVGAVGVGVGVGDGVGLGVGGGRRRRRSGTATATVRLDRDARRHLRGDGRLGGVRDVRGRRGDGGDRGRRLADHRHGDAAPLHDEGERQPALSTRISSAATVAFGMSGMLRARRRGGVRGPAEVAGAVGVGVAKADELLLAEGLRPRCTDRDARLLGARDARRGHEGPVQVAAQERAHRRVQGARDVVRPEHDGTGRDGSASSATCRGSAGGLRAARCRRWPRRGSAGRHRRRRAYRDPARRHPRRVLRSARIPPGGNRHFAPIGASLVPPDPCRAGIAGARLRVRRGRRHGRDGTVATAPAAGTAPADRRDRATTHGASPRRTDTAAQPRVRQVASRAPPDQALHVSAPDLAGPAHGAAVRGRVPLPGSQGADPPGRPGHQPADLQRLHGRRTSSAPTRTEPPGQ